MASTPVDNHLLTNPDAHGFSIQLLSDSTFHPLQAACQYIKQVLLHMLVLTILHFANSSPSSVTNPASSCQDQISHSNPLPGLCIYTLLLLILLPLLLYSWRPWLGAYKAPNMQTKYSESTVSTILGSTLSAFKFDKAGICTLPRVRLGTIQEVGIGAFVR